MKSINPFYNFGGDVTDRLNEYIKVDSQTPATYTYTADHNHYLSALDYGNGDKVQYTYDNFGRVTYDTPCYYITNLQGDVPTLTMLKFLALVQLQEHTSILLLLRKLKTW